AKAAYGLQPGELAISFAANQATRNMFKDYTTIVDAVRRLAQKMQGRAITLLIMGGDPSLVTETNVRIVNLGYISEPAEMARTYNASDVYLHAARAENFPTTILEALACGVPVVATAVGGIPEQIVNLSMPGSDASDAAKATGMLVPSAG